MNKDDPINSHTISVLVDNEPGVLARVIGLFFPGAVITSKA